MNDLLEEVSAILAKANITDPAMEAARIVQAAQASDSEDHASIAKSMAVRRAAGTPLAYVTGREKFMGIELLVDEGALVPREETELLGKTAIDAIRSTGNASPMVIDMCCGSGNLACAIAHHLPNVKLWASDLTDGCISVTRRNVNHVGVSDRVVVKQGDLFAGIAGLGLEGKIDVIVCNPPYISQGKLAADRAVLLEHEPREAFDGGPYGLSIHQRVVKDALSFLRPGGMLMFEIGLGQDRQVKMLIDRSKAYDEIQLVRNAADEIRVVSARKNP